MSIKLYNYKKAFTLVEIIIVVIIVGIVYSLVLVNMNKTPINNTHQDKIINLKQILMRYKFNDNITLKCINEGKLCYILIDDIINKNNKIENLFLTKPTVYTYNKNLEVIEFKDLEFENMESYEVCFKYTIDKFGKTKDMIVEVENKIYLFNSIHNKPKIFEYLSDATNFLEEKKQEFKDAF